MCKISFLHPHQRVIYHSREKLQRTVVTLMRTTDQFAALRQDSCLRHGALDYGRCWNIRAYGLLVFMAAGVSQKGSSILSAPVSFSEALVLVKMTYHFHCSPLLAPARLQLKHPIVQTYKANIFRIECRRLDQIYDFSQVQYHIRITTS
jgi:hypothetical protein